MKTATRLSFDRLPAMAGLFIALTSLIIELDLFKTRAGGAVSIREIVLLSAVVIPAYALATGIFLWKGRSIPRID